LISIPALLTLLVQLSSCASNVCSLSIEEELPSRPLPVAIRDVHDLVLLSDDEFLVVNWSATPVGVLNITHVGRYGDHTVASTPAFVPSGPGTVVRTARDQWWFSRRGDEGVHESIFFVEAGDELRKTRVEVTRRADVWIPLDGDSPRGILVAVDEEVLALVVDEVTPAGVTRLAAFPRQPFRQSPSHGNWSAHVLPDGRIAIVSADDPPDDDVLRVRLVGNGESRELELPCSFKVDATLGSVVDESGRMAIVARSGEGEVNAMLLDDVDEPQTAKCGVISAAGEVAAKLAFASPSVVSAGDRFVAAWVRDDRTIRACELTRLGPAPLIVDIARDADSWSPLLHLIHSDGEVVRFAWKDRSGEIMLRTMPRELSSVAIFEEFQRVLCARPR
jgi:hypothetical protein